MKFLTGILNSKLIEFWLSNKGKMQGENFQIDKDPLMQIPLPSTKCNQSEVTKLVEQIQSLMKDCVSANTSLLEKKIDMLVYHLYNLTYDEVLIIDPETPITREEYENFKFSQNDVKKNGMEEKKMNDEQTMLADSTKGNAKNTCKNPDDIIKIKRSAPYSSFIDLSSLSCELTYNYSDGSYTNKGFQNVKEIIDFLKNKDNVRFFFEEEVHSLGLFGSHEGQSFITIVYKGKRRSLSIGSNNKRKYPF